MEVDAVTIDEDLRDLMNVMTRDMRSEIRQHDAEILEVVRALGGSTSAYRRERSKAVRSLVAEVYSPPSSSCPSSSLYLGSRWTSRRRTLMGAHGISVNRRCATVR